MHNLPPLPTNRSALPIGIFDSGIGGLTVARALRQALPAEHFIYFGDTAHLPYGDKSEAALQAYSIKITDMLLSQPVKAVLIACNSASAPAYELVREYAGSRAVVYNVIDPVVEFVAKTYPGRRVGLIGTRQTVGSNIYRKKLDATSAQVELHALATPLLAPMIEEGFFANSISREVIHAYLSSPELAGIEALVLACTHYPLIATQIEAYYTQQHTHPAVAVLDCSAVVAAHVAEGLAGLSLLNPSTEPGRETFFVSDYTRSFEDSTRYFFGHSVRLEHYPLWS